MVKAFGLSALLVLLAFAAACEATPTVVYVPLDSNAPIGAQAVEAQQRATAAVQQAQAYNQTATAAVSNALALQARATAIQQATANFMAGQQTQIAMQATGTSVSSDARATQAARSAAQAATAIAQYQTATAIAREQAAADAQATRVAQATATANSQTATALAAQATAEAVLAMQTRTSADATATAITLNVQLETMRTKNEIDLEQARAEQAKNDQLFWQRAWAVLLFIVVGGLLALAAWGLWVLIHVLEARHLAIQDKQGMVVAFVIPPSLVGGLLRGQGPQIKVLTAGAPALLPEPPTRAPVIEADTPAPLDSRTLDLAQHRPLAVPLGVTARYPEGWWQPLADLDSVLVGGTRRMGKSNLLHTWIQALSYRHSARLVLFDGKHGVEFGSYAHVPKVRYVEQLAPALGELLGELQTRMDLLRRDGCLSLVEYNERNGTGARLDRLVLVVDELAYALQEPGVEAVLADLIARGGAFGIHPVLATQYPSSETVTPQLKVNLATRIALAVPQRSDSQVILGRAGAEKLPKVPGRYLIIWGGELVEVQAFRALSQPPRPTGGGHSVLDADELKAALAALEHGGWFKQEEIAQAVGKSKRWASNVAQRWENLGWLTEVQRTAGGQNQGRLVTPKLQTLISQNHGN